MEEALAPKLSFDFISSNIPFYENFEIRVVEQQ